jgi:hypothetical protein
MDGYLGNEIKSSEDRQAYRSCSEFQREEVRGHLKRRPPNGDTPDVHKD